MDFLPTMPPLLKEEGTNLVRVTSWVLSVSQDYRPILYYVSLRQPTNQPTNRLPTPHIT